MNKPYKIPKRLINLQSTTTTRELQYEILRALETVSEQLNDIAPIGDCDCALGRMREEKDWYCQVHGHKDFSV